MAAEENKAILQRFNELAGEVFRTGNVDALDEVLAPELVYHQPGHHRISKATNDFWTCSASPFLT